MAINRGITTDLDITGSVQRRPYCPVNNTSVTGMDSTDGPNVWCLHPIRQFVSQNWKREELIYEDNFDN